MRNEQGSGTMLVLMGIAVVVPCAIAVVSVGSLWLAHERSANAADLAALAGASALATGQDPCMAVERIVLANGASLSSCSINGLAVLVEAETLVSEPFGIEVSVPAASRAGPDVG